MGAPARVTSREGDTGQVRPGAAVRDASRNGRRDAAAESGGDAGGRGQVAVAGELAGREAVGGQHGVLDGDGAAVGEPDADQVDHQVARVQPERLRRRLVRCRQPGAHHPGAGHHALAAQQRGHPTTRERSRSILPLPPARSRRCA
jgi:hypothetical protein